MPMPKSAVDPSLRSLLSQLWDHLSRRRRVQLGALLLLMIMSSLGEVVSLAAVLPFLAVLTNPSNIWNQPMVQQWAPYLGIDNAEALLLPITIVFAAAAIGAGAIRLLTLWLNGRLAAAIGSDISCEAYRRTLYQPYEVHVARNSSSLIASISSDVNRVTGLLLNPLLMMMSSAMIVVALVGTLLVIDWSIAVGSGLVIALVYSVALVGSKRPLQQLGQRQAALQHKLIQALQEGLGAIREVLLDGCQQFYIDIYEQAEQPLRREQAESTFLSIYPRLVMEPAGMVLIALVGYFLTLQGGVAKALPLLGALALGTQRLLPMAQKVYEGWAQSRNCKNSLANVLMLLAQPLPIECLSPPLEPIFLRENIIFEEVHFRYAPDQSEVLQGVNLEIRRGERIGLIGSTGSGKSTLADLLMGLLKQSEGRILVDGFDIHDPNHPDRQAAWRTAIAHVPQSIFLADTSIAENIAFGIPKEQIDFGKIRHSAEQAQIAGFIESSSQGYETLVGEHGVRLSGGQRQRVGIARALYKSANVVVLDEATSALDNATESNVIKALEGLSRDMTIIIIAHRLSTLASCDRIFELIPGSPIRITTTA